MNNSYCNGEIVSAFLGCTDESALNYNSNANQDDGSCYFENNSDLCVANPMKVYVIRFGILFVDVMVLLIQIRRCSM